MYAQYSIILKIKIATCNAIVEPLSTYILQKIMIED